MRQKPQPRPTPQPVGRIRAFRTHDLDSQIERSRMLLGLSIEFSEFDPARPQRLARALRLARRAARGGMADYDPARHLVLSRYFRSVLQSPNGFGDNRKNPKPAREDV